MQLFLYILVFIVGLYFGSLCDILGNYLPEKRKGILKCSCKKSIKIIFWLPIIGYFISKGKCNHCKKRVSFAHPFTQLLTGLLFLVSFYLFGFNIKFIISLIFSLVAVILIVSDSKYMIINDEVLIVGAILIIFLTYLSGVDSVIDALINGVISFLIMLLIKLLADILFRKEAMGGGDVKLLAFIGILVDYKMSIIVLCASAFLAFPYAIYIYLKKNENILPLGPFICMAGLIIYFLGLNFEDLMRLMAN